MGLTEVQAALAHLYTDAAAREQLRTGREAFTTRFSLTEAEASALAEQVLGEAEDFARSLTRKRFEEATRSLPQTRAVLGRRFAPWFAEYAAATPFTAGHSPALDALDFHAWLRTRKAAELSSIELDALRYEQGWLTMQNSHRQFLVRWLAVPDAGASRVLVVWWRWRGKLRHWISR